MAGIELYDFELDENCYRVRLVLSMLGIAWTPVAVDALPGLEHRSPAMLELNPRGEIPILIDDGIVFTGATAIMAYLARAHDPAGSWLPIEPVAFGQVQAWLEFAATALKPAYDARFTSLFGPTDETPRLAKQARDALRILDDFLIRRGFEGADWFVGDGPTLADLALFPAFALSRDFGVEHAQFAALRRWSRRVRALAGFKTMPGIPDYY